MGHQLEIEPVASPSERFEILSHIADGPLGPIFTAFDNKDRSSLGSLRVLVTLGMIDRALLASEANRMTLRSNLSKLEQFSHRNILRVFECIDSEDGEVIVSEYIPGAQFSDFLGQAKLAPHDVLDIVKQLCAGYRSLRQQKMPAGDASPQNIKLLSDGRIKINPIGANLLNEQKGERFAAISPRYIAPENLSNPASRLDNDQYAVGAIGFELLEGSLFEGSPSSRSKFVGRIRNIVRALLHTNTQEAPELKSVLQKMTARNSTDRFPDLKKAEEALAKINLRNGSPSHTQSVSSVVAQWQIDQSQPMSSGQLRNQNLFLFITALYFISVLGLLALLGPRLFRF